MWLLYLQKASSDKGVDVATVFTEGLIKGKMWLLYLQKI